MSAIDVFTTWVHFERSRSSKEWHYCKRNDGPKFVFDAILYVRFLFFVFKFFCRILVFIEVQPLIISVMKMMWLIHNRDNLWRSNGNQKPYTIYTRYISNQFIPLFLYSLKRYYHTIFSTTSVLLAMQQ